MSGKELVNRFQWPRPPIGKNRVPIHIRVFNNEVTAWCDERCVGREILKDLSEVVICIMDDEHRACDSARNIGDSCEDFRGGRLTEEVVDPSMCRARQLAAVDGNDPAGTQRFKLMREEQRRATEVGAKFGNVLVPAGAQLTLAYGSANRDTAVFGTDPGESAADIFDIQRRSRSSFGFGWGTRNCIGEQLARIVAGAAFKALVNHRNELELVKTPTSNNDTDLATDLVWMDDPYFHFLQTLMLRVV